MAFYRVSNGGTPHEIFTRYGYPIGYSFDDKKVLPINGWTVIGNYVSYFIPESSANTYKLTCIKPCTVDVYTSSGLVATHTLTTVGQTVTATGNRLDEALIIN
jgi:hypothetical protein